MANALYEIATFDNPKNIVIGQARIIWATKDGYPPAWVLPGGIRTTDKHEATAYAVRLDRLLLGR